MHYLIHKQLDLNAQLILLGALDRRKRFVEVLYRRIADVGNEVGEVFGALELDLALDLRNDRLGIHVLRNMLCDSFLFCFFFFSSVVACVVLCVHWEENLPHSSCLASQQDFVMLVGRGIKQ